MSFLAPYLLIGLTGLSVPIIVHLWSKNTRKTVDFGSIRFLKSTETKTMRSISPSQWLLLLLRLSLLTLFVFLMAGLAFPDSRDRAQRTTLVDPLLGDYHWVEEARESNEGADFRWLTSGFPMIEDEPGSLVNYWRLLSNLDEIQTEEIWVVSPLNMNDFIGARVSLDDRITWVKINADPQRKKLTGFRKSGEGFDLVANYSDTLTSFEVLENSEASDIELTYYVNRENEALTRIFEAAIRSINDLGPFTLLETRAIETADWVFWLSQKEIPSRPNVIAASSSQLAPWLNHADGNVTISMTMDEQMAVRENLGFRLLNELAFGIFEPSDEQLSLDENSLTLGVEASGRERNRQAGIHWWTFLIVLFLAERWLAVKSEMA